MQISHPSSRAARTGRSIAGRARRRAAGSGALAVVGLTVAAGVCAQDAADQPGTASRPASEFARPAGYLQVHTGLSYTDNVFLTPENKRGAAVGSAGFDVDYAHKGSRFDFDSHGALSWIDYFNHAFGGVASGALNAKALLGSPNDLLQWATWETFGQLDTDPLAAPTPVNIENVNYFTTGPSVNLPFGSEDRLSLRALYSISSYQKSPYDSRNTDTGASWSHAFSDTSGVVLDIDSRRTVFRVHQIAPDYQVRSAFLGYTAGTTRTRFSAEVGYTAVSFQETRSGSPLYTLSLDRRISPSSTIYLQTQTGFSGDTGSIRSSAGLIAPNSSFAAASSPNPFKQESVSLGWNFERPRAALSLFSSTGRQRYEQRTTLDQKNLSLQASFLYRLGPSLSATAAVQRVSEKYSSLGASVTQSSLIVGLTRKFFRGGLSLRYESFHRGGSSAVSGTIGVYDGNRIALYLTYDLVGQHVNTNGMGEP